MIGLLIGIGILIALFIGLSSYLDLKIGWGFLSILGIALFIIIVFFSVIHYGGRSAQTMNPPGDGEWRRTADGWRRSGQRDFRGGYIDSSGRLHENP